MQSHDGDMYAMVLSNDRGNEARRITCLVSLILRAVVLSIVCISPREPCFHVTLVDKVNYQAPGQVGQDSV